MREVPVINEQLEEVCQSLQAIALNTARGDGGIESFKSLRNLIRTNQIRNYLTPGEKIKVSKESGIYTSATGSITGATVNEDTFIAAVNNAGTHAYEFIYDGAAWTFGGDTVELSEYGLAATGTPAEDDRIVVHVQASLIYFDTVAIDYDVPVNPNLKHSVSFLTQDVQIYGSVPYCAPQALKAITAEEFPEGLKAGTTYYITLLNGCYDGTTKQDGSYNFTPTKDVPVGGKIGHTTMGLYQSSAAQYTPATIAAGTFITYDASYSQIETCATAQGATGTSLGTTTASDPTKLSGGHINFTQRNAYGSNNPMHSAQRKWRESDAAGAANGEIASWWYASDEFDMPVRSTLPGFLHGIDPEFLAICVPVRKRTALSVADGYGHIDTEHTVWCPSMTEMGLGKNNDISETAAKADGTVATEAALDLYVGATTADRIKTQAGTAGYWWLRSPFPSIAYTVRRVDPSGELYNYGSANNTHGAVAGLTAA